MALAQDAILRQDEIGGKSVRTFKDGSNIHNQGVAVVDDAGSQTFIEASPAFVRALGAGIQKRLEVDPFVDAFAVTFDKWFNNKLVTAELFNAGSVGIATLVPKTNAGIQIAAGAGANCKATVRSKFEVPYIPGIGQTVGFSIRITNINTPVSGHRMRWGIGDQTDGVLIEWDGSAAGSTQLRLVFYSGGTPTTITSNNWDKPVIYSGGTGRLKQDMIQLWTINWDWTLSRCLITLDGTLVHTYTPSNPANPLTNVTGGRMMVMCHNTSSVGSNNYIMLYAMYTLMSGGSSNRFLNYRRRRMWAKSVAMAASTSVVAMALYNRPSISVSGQTIKNYRALRIRRIVTSTYPTTATVADWNGGVHWNLERRYCATPGSIAFDDSPPDPDTAFGNIAIPIITVLTGTNAAGAGYSATNTTKYKVTAVGARGETLPSTYASTAINVLTPAQQVKVTLIFPVPNAVAYKIYRQVNGAGSYVLIGWADAVSMMIDGFIDDGYVATAGTPPGARTAEAESFATGYVLPSANSNAGVHFMSYVSSSGGGPTVLDFEDGALILHPGEMLAWINDGPLMNSAADIAVEWDEE